MSHLNTSDWYDSLRNELKSNSLSIEKVSRRSEYWRKSNLDIVSDLVQEISQIDLSHTKGTYLYEPDLTVHGDILEFTDEKGYQVSSILDVIADEESFAKNYFGRLEKKSQRLIPRPLARDNTLSPKVGLVPMDVAPSYIFLSLALKILTRLAYTPKRGIIHLPNWIFAVGNPNFLPLCSPFWTLPITEW